MKSIGMSGVLAMAVAAAAVLGSTAVRADDFDVFTAIPSSVAVDSLPEATPLVLGNPSWTHRTIADRNTQLSAGQTNSGAWDMITLNETGPGAGRYLFLPFETGLAGVQRTDLMTDTTITIVADGTQGFVAGDMSRWSPWGSYITAEESWGTNSNKGRLFELTNPTTTTGPATSNFVQRNILPRVSHEGLVFDKNMNMYFIDEFNGGSLYKYTPVNNAPVNGDQYFAAGQSSVLRVGDGSVNSAAGAASWIALTDVSGTPLAGTTIATNGNGAIDGRITTDTAAFKGTNYNRPEDMEIQKQADGSERIYMPTTGSNQIFSIWLKNDGSTEVSLFVDRNTIDLATGLPVGSALTSPDNVAIDSKGNIYIIEDQPGGVADIWFATDVDRNGVAESISRWATMSTRGAEMTGLYFDPFNVDIAYLAIQHPDSGNDRLIQIVTGDGPAGAPVPEPASLGMMAAGALGLLMRRRKA